MSGRDVATPDDDAESATSDHQLEARTRELLEKGEAILARSRMLLRELEEATPPGSPTDKGSKRS